MHFDTSVLVKMYADVIVIFLLDLSEFVLSTCVLVN